MILKDRMLNFIRARMDIEALIQSYFPEYETDGCVLCPFHEDGEPSLHISPEGKAYCHSGSCNFRATNIVELYAKLEEMSYLEARQVLYEDLVNAIPMSTVEKYVRALSKRKAPMKYLMGRRLNRNTISKYMLGFESSSGRITIPIFDEHGSCVNIRRIAWGKALKDSKYRALNTRGHGECRLYPEKEIVRADRMVLVGGEWDALIGRQCGLPTATWTGGEGSWNHAYDWMFRDKAVFILYDNDDAGKEGAKAAERKLKKAGACRVENLMHLMKAKDLNDWYREDWQSVLFLAADVESQVIVRDDIGICPYCGQSLPEGFKETESEGAIRRIRD